MNKQLQPKGSRRKTGCLRVPKGAQCRIKRCTQGYGVQQKGVDIKIGEYGY